MLRINVAHGPCHSRKDRSSELCKGWWCRSGIRFQVRFHESTSKFPLFSFTSPSDADSAAKAIIPEGPEVFIRSGSTIHLSCVITASPSPPAYVFWYRDGSVINYDSPRGRVRVTTDKGKTTVSRLQISKARATDGGDYACKPSYSDVANVSVHIISYSGSYDSCHRVSCCHSFCFTLLGGNHQAVQQSDSELAANSIPSATISSLMTSSSSYKFVTILFLISMRKSILFRIVI